MVLIYLLKNITLRHLRLHKGRTILSIIGIALGVSVFISVQLAITRPSNPSMPPWIMFREKLISK